MRTVARAMAIAAVLLLSLGAVLAAPLESWNDGAAKKAIEAFVREDAGKRRISQNPDDRISHAATLSLPPA